MTSGVFLLLSRHILPHDSLIVGVSGGPDSVALLDVLCSPSLHAHLIVAHVNHGIRGTASDADEKFVRKLAKSYGLKCEVKRVKLAGKMHQEELGRKIRRGFFEKLRIKHSAKWILTAHTRDDQIETIILNFLRGSGPAGLAGMKVRRSFYVKPFLKTPKAEILKYLKDKKLKFRTDATNNDTSYRRNFVRKKILPLFAKVNPSFRKTLLRNAATFRSLSVWTNRQAEQFLNGSDSFSAKEFQKLPLAMRRAVLQGSFQKFSKQSYRLSSVRIAEMLRLVQRNVGNKKIMLPGGGVFYLNTGLVGYRAS